MRKRINWIFSIVLTVLLLSLMPTRAEAGAAVTINSVVAAAENVMPALGKTAAVDGTDITITSPADLPVRVDPDRSGHYWRYSDDGEEWTDYYASDNAPFKKGYWQCRLNFWIDSSGSIEFGDECTVNINGTLWPCSVSTNGKLLYARSPVYVMDSSGTILKEIESVKVNCAAFPSLFTAGKKPAAPGEYVTTEGIAVIDNSNDVWQVMEDGAWRDMGSAETCVGGSAYRLKTTLTMPKNHSFMATLGRDVALTVNGNEWTVDHTSMKERSTVNASVTVYSHTVYAANEVCTITFYDINKPDGENVVGTLKVPGGEYTLPECTFPSSHKDIIFDYWEWENLDGDDVKKQPGEKIMILEDTTIYLYWKWKPGVNKVTFDLSVSDSYTYGIKASAFSLTLKGGQHISLVNGGCGQSYWIECGGQKVEPDTILSTVGSYSVAVNFRLEEGYMAAFTENSVILDSDSDALGELACRTPVEQDDGSYIARFSLPHIPGTPISADKVIFTLEGYEVGKMVQAIKPSISTDKVSFYGSGYGKEENGCAYLVYTESNEAYVYFKPIYDSTSFWASTDYWLDIRFTLEGGCSLPESFWSGTSLIKDKFVLSGIEGAEVETVSKSSLGYYIRFKLPQLGNKALGAVKVTLDGYEVGKMAQDVVVTLSDNISPFRYTPQEHYINQHYFFTDPNNDDLPVDAYTKLQSGRAYNFTVWLNIAKGYDASKMIRSDLVICTPHGDCIAKTIEEGLWDSSYKVTFQLPQIGTADPRYVVTVEPGEGTGDTEHHTDFKVGDTYTLPQMKDIAFTAPNGMRFKSWSVDGAEKQPGDKITITGYTLVTALWRPYTSVTVDEITVHNLSLPVAGVAFDKNGAHKGTTLDSDVYRIATRSWYDVTAEKTMNDGDAFIEGNTYRYTFAIVLKDAEYDKFAASAEDISVTVAGAYEIEKGLSGSIMMCKAYFVCKAIEPVASGSVTVSGAAASASVTVEGLEGTKALLIVAQYSGKQMKALRCRSVTSDCVVIPESFAHSAGYTYKVFLVSSGVCVPLCSPTVLSQ